VRAGCGHDGKKVANWADVLGDLASVFHFPPSELLNMTMDEMMFWHAQAVRIEKLGKKHGQ